MTACLPPSETARAPSPWRSVLRLGLLLAGLLASGLALRGFAGQIDTGLIDRLVIGHGPTGQFTFVALAAAACASGVPRQAAGFAAGYAFGTDLGLTAALSLALFAQIVGCAANFFWARAVARAWTQRRLHGRLARLEATLASNPFTMTLIVRLLPVGNNTIFSLAGGASSVAAVPFHIASAIGYLPQTLVFVLLGSGARVAGWQRIVLAVGLFVISALLGVWLLRRHRAEASAVIGGS